MRGSSRAPLGSPTRRGAERSQAEGHASRAPRPAPCGGTVATGRMFSCRRCGEIVVLCVACFRGHRYCDACRLPARKASRHRARLNYARSPEGILGNADRQRDWRRRQRIARTVTDHSSSDGPLPGTLHASGLPPDMEVPIVVEPAAPDAVDPAAPAADVPPRAPAIDPSAPRPSLPRCACCGQPIRALLLPGLRRPYRRPSG